MSQRIDTYYFAQRAAQSLLAAERATDVCARMVHVKLAAAYQRLAGQGTPQEVPVSPEIPSVPDLFTRSIPMWVNATPQRLLPSAPIPIGRPGAGGLRLLQKA